MDSVPVAEQLLQTKLFGIPVRRLAHSVAIPLSPALLLSLVGFPITVVGPVLVLGVGIGAVLFYRTPECLSPFTWVRAAGLWILTPAESFWQPARQEDSPSVWLERWRSSGENRTRRGSAPVSLPKPIFGDRDSASGLDFEYVRDDGTIVSDAGYARIVEIEATPWLILGEAARESTVKGFERYLAGVGSSVQFLSLPVPFDIDPHRSAVTETAGHPETESTVLQTGRVRHGEWLERVVREGDVTDRRHFVVVSVPETSDEPSLGSASDRDGLADAVAELDARAENARSSLPRTGVSTTVLTDRNAVLEVLYRYYRGQAPPSEMDHGWLTRPAGGQQ